MNKIYEIFKTNKYVIIWTIAYIAIVWSILLFMFNFNIFVGHQWQLLMNAELKGFAGFVFGILILAALPMYIATTMVIVRTKQPLVTININPIIKIFNAVIPHPVPAIAQPAPQNTTAAEITDSATIAPDTQVEEFPQTMPPELRGAFIRARQHIDRYTPSAFNPAPGATPISSPTTDTIEPVGDLPLPTDFDFDPEPDSEFVPPVSMPTFTDINFSGDDEEDDIDEFESDNISPATAATNNDDLTSYLTEQGITPTPHGDLIIAKDMIIATHSDPEFWIADPENWFAAGKQKTSPVVQLIKASAPLGLKPVLYLAQTNIMELDTCCETWEKMGVNVITDLNKLPL